MEKVFLLFLSVVLFEAVNLTLAHPVPADHREDTVLPFSLSPGNVNLETYYLDKYPKPGAGGPIKKEPPVVDRNMFVENKDGAQARDAHAIFRTRRTPNPQYYPYHTRGAMNGVFGQEHRQIHHQSSYDYEHRHRQYNHDVQNRNLPRYHSNHFHD